MIKLAVEDSKLIAAVLVVVIIFQRPLLAIAEPPDLCKKPVEMAGDGVNEPGRQGKGQDHRQNQDQDHQPDAGI